MSNEPETITINDVEYVRKDSAMPEMADDYVIIRTYSAGVHAGVLQSQS